MCNREVKRTVLGPRVRSLEQALNQSRLEWLRHVVRMRAESLPR